MLRAKRVRTPLFASRLAEQHCTCGGASTSSSILQTQRRFLKAHDVREYKPLGMPLEMQFYQRHTTRPEHASGIQFLTHYEDHKRWYVKRDFIDYLNWGREQGQAHLPHRQHRVAFDFNDRVHPTLLPTGARGGQFEGQDPSFATGSHPDLSTSFNPNKLVYSEPKHFNALYGEGQPQDVFARITRTKPLDPRGADAGFFSHTHVAPNSDFLGHLPGLDKIAFQNGCPPIDKIGLVPGRVPGLNAPYRGEPDGQHMQAMSQPLTDDNRITGNDGRFSKTLYINDPTRDNVLTASLAKELGEQIDIATNAVYSKLVVLKAAQSGLTDRFSSGMDIEQYSYDIAMAHKYEGEAADLLAQIGDMKSSNIAKLTATQRKTIDSKAQEKLELATRHRMRVDDALRSQSGLLWRAFTAARPFLTFINGRCHNTGCGLALMSKFPALRDSTEFIVDGPNFGLSPYGGMTNLLARPETRGKVPGLAEFTVLTGNALYAGDALRLGWSEYYTQFQDMDYHIKDWFNNSEHMHNDAMAWQLGHLLEKCFKVGEHHSNALERCAITPTRARWIEDAFADQKSVDHIVATLGQMERLATGSDAAASGNNFDVNNLTPYSLYDVDAGIAKLTQNNLSFALAPWDITPPSDPKSVEPTRISGDSNDTSNFAAVFTSYVFETDAKGKEVAVLPRAERLKMKAWRKQRYGEYQEHVRMLNRPVKRHVFARIEGCDGKLVDFEYFFDRKKLEMAAIEAAAAARSASGGYSTELNTINDGTGNALIKDLLKQVANKMGYDPARPLELGWYLPTLDTAKIRTDDELVKVLQTDPGFEAPQEFPTAHPPIYFIVKRATLHMSEWAYATKHQILLSSPFALKASYQLLNDVRTGRAASAATAQQKRKKQLPNAEDQTEIEVAETSIQSMSETLATEFRYISRLVGRADFYKVGYNATRTMSDWEELEQSKAVNLHNSDNPTNKPAVDYDDVFARNVTIDGHKFLLRPKWSPATLAEVSDAEIAALAQPLNFEKDNGLTEIHVPTYANKSSRIAASINDNGGFEVVPGLGEPTTNAASGAPSNSGEEKSFRVPPLEADAHVPNNVNFYIMARHPWTDQPNSWRKDTFTDASLEYMTDKYKDALGQINQDANRQGQGNNSSYWPTKAELEGDGSFESEEETLLKDRLYNAVDIANNKVEQWASSLRSAAQKQKIDYKLEITTQQERFYDDNYYRWFVRPGEHPNPSGLLRHGKAVKVEDAGSSAGANIDPEALMASFEESGAFNANTSRTGHSAITEEGTVEEVTPE